MKILAKSILALQMEARKSLDVEGIEILLLEKDFEDLKSTKESLVRVASEWPLVGLEAMDGTSKYGMNPFSANKREAQFSRDLLLRYVDMINELNAKTKNIPYAQFQYLLDKFVKKGKEYRAKPVDKNEQLERIRLHFNGLSSISDIELQLENITQVNPAKDGSLRHCYTTLHPRDFSSMGIPMALDVIHLAQTLYIWSQATKKDSANGLYPVVTRIDGKTTRIYIQMSDYELEIGNRIRGDIKRTGIRNAITSEIVSLILKYGENIGSLQFANAKVGFGAEFGEDGIATSEGMIDLKRLFNEAIILKNIPYVIPEFEEQDYTKPVNQRKAVNMVKDLINNHHI